MNLIRHYPIPDAPETRMFGASCDECAGQCESGKRCPKTFATTEPGDLAPPREEQSIAGTGLVISLVLVFGGVCLGSALALAFNGWPK